MSQTCEGSYSTAGLDIIYAAEANTNLVFFKFVKIEFCVFLGLKSCVCYESGVGFYPRRLVNAQRLYFLSGSACVVFVFFAE